ncbi:ISL3 family transposase [Nonomuraea sp. NPDC059194]|uniref:ISL3 family transposase n=1 Tax=Nonomuraea sp. NPDC059194 TaxID=3346764 RepID=UPI0036AB0D49
MVVNQVQRDDTTLILTAKSPDRPRRCPRCAEMTNRVHSRYQRRLSDTAIGGSPVEIRLRVRRMICPRPECPTATFAEQIPDLTSRYGRRTPVLRGVTEQIGLALAGRAGARLCEQLAIPASGSTLLRLVMALPEPEPGDVTVLGVDDFAFKKGHVYGTVLVDMATNSPIDILDTRTGQALATWLADHPGVKVICRDRAGAYAEGATTGAPDAIQVADRFHLWRNLSDYVDKAVHRNRAALKEPNVNEPSPAPSTQSETSTAGQGAAPAADASTSADDRPASRMETRTRERYAAVHALVAKGIGNTAICRILGLDHKTVLRFARASSVDELLVKVIDRPGLLDPFKPYLRERWNDGCTDATRLTKEIVERGYTGSNRTVRRYLHDFRGAEVPALKPMAGGPAPKDATGWILRHPDSLDEDEKLQLKHLRERCPQLDRLAGHVTAFAEMMTNRHGYLLEQWLTDVEAGDIPELHRLAAGLRRDQAAVTAGLTLEHSSGAVEGNVNRIKMLKRQTYGRAGLALLRKRILLNR